jgi:cell division protein ZapE
MRPELFPPDSAPVFSIAERYRRLVARGRIKRDTAQEAAIDVLDRLREGLKSDPLARKSRALGWLFAAKAFESGTRGVYLWGPVGRGKTMLMDLFFETVGLEEKRRTHVHAFMAEVHARIHAWRLAARAGKAKGDDPVGSVAAALAGETRLLCLDEFAVTNIADAMILGRLFQGLFAGSVAVVATSNAAPDELYKDGLNRALFLPFVELLRAQMEIVHLDAAKDFRLEKLSSEPVYRVPADAAARAALDRTFLALTGRERGAPADLAVLGHRVHVPEAAAGVARFSFDDLCRRSLGAVDYGAIAERFHTIVLDGIPVIPADARDEAQRFIRLIDTLYDRGVKLIASAAAEPFDLYPGGHGREASEFRRAASRLMEMRSNEYLALPRRQAPVSGIAET